MFLAISIFILALVLIIVRPRPLNEATAAAIGALLMLAGGIVSPGQVIEVLRLNANVLFFFLGLMLVSTMAQQAGFFQWSALKAIKLARGHGRNLLLVIFALGTAITTFFSNDATALILTPIVYTITTQLKLSPMPYIFACAFIANTASMLLPVSNPVNLLPVDRFSIPLSEYMRFLLVPSLLVIAINIAIFLLIFQKDIAVRFAATDDTKDLLRPAKTDSFFVFVCVGLALTALGYILASVNRLPLSWPALGGALFLLAGAVGFRRLKFEAVKAGLSWPIFLFIFSLALMVRGLENAGITDALGKTITNFASRGSLSAILATTLGTALGSNLINNWSMMMVSVSSLASADGFIETSHRSLVYSSILGADLGPNITILGSLSSMLWLVLLKQRGLDVHPVLYLKLGLIVVPPMLFTGALAIYVGSLL
ncbi:MAG: arsenic transporter [Chloroflexi bacterium]|nr:arsenic transporter [Chloroflexota bacterium]